MPIDDLTLEQTMALSQLASTPEGAKQIVDTLTKHVIPKRRNLFRAPYYRECYGKEIAPALEAILKDHKDRIIFYSDFPYLTKKSLYLRIYQAKAYAEENIPELTDARVKVGVRTDKTGIRLKFLTNNPKPIIAHEIENPNALSTWKEELETFIVEGAIGTKFLKDNIDLTKEEQHELRVMLTAIPGVIHVVKQHEIKVLKIDPDNPPI